MSRRVQAPKQSSKKPQAKPFPGRRMKPIKFSKAERELWERTAPERLPKRPKTAPSYSDERKLFQTLRIPLGNLYGRWLDEREYEDIADYGKAFEKSLKKNGGTLVKMHARPFGATFTWKGWKYRISTNMTMSSMQRMK